MSLSTSPFRKSDLAGAMQQNLLLFSTLKDDSGRTLLALLFDPLYWGYIFSAFAALSAQSQ
jgi:hypothetical protein